MSTKEDGQTDVQMDGQAKTIELRQQSVGWALTNESYKSTSIANVLVKNSYSLENRLLRWGSGD